MIVPEFWSEAKVQGRIAGKRVVVRRFGWSDVSEADAAANAEQRCREALRRIESGESLERSEPKIPYNGADGVPIREEVVRRQGDTVITRNSYGALCLNTPDVLFADIDFETKPALRTTLSAAVGSAILGWILTAELLGGRVAWLGAALAAVVGGSLTASVWRTLQRLRGGAEASAMRRLQRFVAAHPLWHLRVYRTPAGLRALAMHRGFDPREAETQAFFSAVDVDRVYRRMCENQRCFRARLTAKPWRIGIVDHLRPRPGVWPVAPERRALRSRWLADYDAKARQYSACRFVAALGSSTVDSRAHAVQALHDDLCRCAFELPLA